MVAVGRRPEALAATNPTAPVLLARALLPLLTALRDRLAAALDVHG
ncbi:hypothetical protein [Kitasatospora phosalacinea]|nr:hypothetical protein [Kitasatospora phosalacinea]